MRENAVWYLAAIPSRTGYISKRSEGWDRGPHAELLAAFLVSKSNLEEVHNLLSCWKYLGRCFVASESNAHKMWTVLDIQKSCPTTENGMSEGDSVALKH